MDIPIFDKNIFFNSNNNNLIGFNHPILLGKMANTTNFSNDIKDIKLFKEPLQYKFNTKINIEEDINLQKNEQNNKNDTYNIINNNENEKNINEEKKNTPDIFPNFPSFINDSNEILNKNKTCINLSCINKNRINKDKNGIDPFSSNNKNPIKNVYCLKDPFIFNNNNNIYFNDFRQTYNKMLIPGLNQFSIFSSIKNNFFNSDFSNFPSNQNKNKNEVNKVNKVENKNSK